MKFGERLMNMRKEKKLSQIGLAHKVGIHANVLGRYERGESKPFLEMAVKLAKALDVSLDFLTGSESSPIDHEVLKRIQLTSKLPKEEQQKIFDYIDLIGRDYQAKEVYSR